MNLLTPRQRLGTVLDGRYGLESVIGQGGMSTVFGARHLLSGRAVAIKLLHPHLCNSAELRERFMREARAIATLEHPHVVEILDVGADPQGATYLVLERLRGESLGSRLRRQPLSLGEVQRYLLPVMRAAAMAHERGLVHRDLKPDNVFLAEAHDGSISPKLLDFGIASGRGDDKLTETGHVLGTARYMAPEQARALPPTPSADVWSMGALVFRSLSGRTPFTGATGAVLQALLTQPAPSLREVRPELPDAVIGAVDSALKTRVEARWTHMGQFEGALRSAIADAHHAGWQDAVHTPAPLPPREHTPMRVATHRAPRGPRVASLVDSVPPELGRLGEVEELPSISIPIDVELPRRRHGSRTIRFALAAVVGLVVGLATGAAVVGPDALARLDPTEVIALPLPPAPALEPAPAVQTQAAAVVAPAEPGPSVAVPRPEAPLALAPEEPTEPEETLSSEQAPVVTLEPTHLRQRRRRIRRRTPSAPSLDEASVAEEPREEALAESAAQDSASEAPEPTETNSLAAPDPAAPGALVNPWSAFDRGPEPAADLAPDLEAARP